MLSGSAFLRVFLVLIAAVVLTGLVQRYWLFDSEPPETPSATAGSARRPPEAKPAPTLARPAETVIKPFPKAAEAPALVQLATPAAQPSAPPAPSPVPSQTPPARTVTEAARPAAVTPPPPAPEEAAPGDAGTEPRAVDLVDLNTGSLAALNGLKGGGVIGRAIIQNRPYASTDQLLSKRVLSRAIYQRIKDQVTVR